ncbi:MAG: L-2-amino-thiazoline-4-carboxylic acid hydrolase [Candidatus Thorarchaeota archaeon]|nr:L-2-amino-thiazoline-4-carboxylic acid hydrolase [Candidatus Thorarchaeota archaeon]
MDDSKHKFDKLIEGVTYREWVKGEYVYLVKFIRNLEGILGKERTHEIVAKHNMQLEIESRQKSMDALEKPFESLEDVKNWFHKMKKSKVAQMCQTNNDVPSPPGTYRFCVTECLWASVFRAFDAADIGNLMMCRIDFGAAKIYSPKLTLNREKTVMDGKECCAFTYTWDE